MSKNIVLCADGTSNKGGIGQVTNVWRIYQALDLTQNNCGGKKTQIAIHDDGVGTENLKWLKLISGATGLGLKRKIRQLYMFLCRNYESGDTIYLFGFSRGAYTVRALAGLIAKCGIVDKARCQSDREFTQLAKKAMRIYRGNYQSDSKREKSRKQAEDFIAKHGFQDEAHAVDGKITIRFVGVWDTVDAYGLPWDGLTDALDKIYPFKFRDRTLSDQVVKGSHAIAVDDQRDTFHPVMWDEEDAREEHVNQVWFAGMHSNVGGGYPKDGMAMVTLNWMMAEAESEGLCFLPHKREEVRNQANAQAKMYDSRSGFGAYYRYEPRHIDRICRENHISTCKIHQSVYQRLKAAVAGYAPANLPAEMTLVDTGNQPPHPQLQNWQFHAKGLQGQHQLLDKVGWQLSIRRLLHYMFALISLGFAGYLCWDLAERWPRENMPEGLKPIPLDSTMELIKWCFFYILENPVPYALFLTTLLIFFLGYFAKKKMQRTFEEFWFSRRPS